MNDEWLLPKEVAHRAGVCVKTVYRAIKDGRVRADKVSHQVRIAADDVDKLRQRASYGSRSRLRHQQ